MKKILEINAASFFTSNASSLAWTIRETEHGGTSKVSGEHVKLGDENALSEALGKHLQQIGAALPDGQALSDYEVTLVFDDQLDDRDKQAFTAAFNDSNTRDESF